MLINGDWYIKMLRSAAISLDNEKDHINDLNVFPVPDGDTGINMALTLTGVHDELTLNGKISDAADKAAITLLRGARGNSGVILSMFFRGVSKSLKGKAEADANALAEAFSNGTKFAYGAVMSPKEGTILTVMRAFSDGCEQYVGNGGDDVTEMITKARGNAQEILEKTPEMLPILKEANVVDAGGTGFVAVVDGFIAALNGIELVPNDESAKKTAKTADSADFSGFSTENIVYPYCTECIITKSAAFRGEDTCDRFHQFAMKMGDSVVFVDDEEIVKLHVHTKDPGKILTEALKYGTLYTVKVENMKNQHNSLVVKENEAQNEKREEKAVPAKPFGFVSVCAGEGISEIFKEIGVDQIVMGGQTMNPSTDDLLKAIEKTPAKTVIVLPNNGNIIMAAEQCVELVKDRRVVVIKSRTIPQGVSAMLAFDPDATYKQNAETMSEAVKTVRTYSVTYAAHDSVFDGTEIRKGQILGLSEGKLAFVTDDRMGCLAKIAEELTDSAMVTLYFGEGVPDEEKAAAEEFLGKAVKGAEIVPIDGGQPVYTYLIAAE